MNYGYFDEVNKEYVITKPNTPAPWANYLGSPAYGAIISNNAGGYSFVKSGANGRVEGFLVGFLAAGGKTAGYIQERVPPRNRLHEHSSGLRGYPFRGALLRAA